MLRSCAFVVRFEKNLGAPLHTACRNNYVSERVEKTFTILAAAAPPRRERGRAELKAGESDAGMATKADAEAIVARMTDLRSMVI